MESRADYPTFTAQEIVTAMRERGARHLATTIRHHVVTAMGRTAVGRVAGNYNDLERVMRGRFLLL
ncbi:hypothetical protein [Deinococcus apachensis]|uniref:hypothetical protein n=1 Tax=Deinococcus apachensis TaxID=309886 RepID=UPI000380D323|nr:hypothetical protein [Deinococcus apachensis]